MRARAFADKTCRSKSLDTPTSRLGWPPPRAGNLWSGPNAPQRPAEQLFADADYVLIPRFSTIGAWTQTAIMTLYEARQAEFPIESPAEFSMASYSLRQQPD